MQINRLLLVLLVSASLLIAVFLFWRYRVPPSIILPEMVLTDLQGRKADLSAYKGRPVFINFFATWCGPCIGELPELISLQEDLAGQKLMVICIADEPIEKLRDIDKALGGRLLILHSEKHFKQLGIYTYPTNYIYDSHGSLIYQKVEPDNWSDRNLIEKIRKLIS